MGARRARSNNNLLRSHEGRVTGHGTSLSPSRQAWTRQELDIDTHGDRPVPLT